jgi:prevent-host-death family protein
MTSAEPTAMPSTYLHTHLADVLKRVSIQHEHIVVYRAEYPVVAIIPVEEYRKLLQLRQKTEKPV